MKKIYTFLLMLIATMSWCQTPTLGELRDSDRREIKDKAKKRIEDGLDQFFNQLIGEEELGDFEFNNLVMASCNFSNSQIFYQDNVRIKNDYNPLLLSNGQVIRDYFSGFRFMKKNTPDARFTFKIENIDELRQNNHLYLEINYSLTFDGYYENRVQKNGKIAIEKVPFKEQHRMAQLRAEKIGKKWELLIEMIGNNESIKPVIATQTAVAKIEPKADIPVQKTDVTTTPQTSPTKPVEIKPKPTEIKVVEVQQTSPVKPVEIKSKPTETKVVEVQQTSPPKPVEVKSKPTETKVADVQQTNTPKPAEIKPAQIPTKPKDSPYYSRNYSSSKSGSGSILAKIVVAATGVGAGVYGYWLNSSFQSAKIDLEAISPGASTQVSSQIAGQYNAAYDKALAAQGKKGLSTAMLGVAGVAAVVEVYLWVKPSNNNTVGFKIRPASVGIGVGISYHF